MARTLSCWLASRLYGALSLLTRDIAEIPFVLGSYKDLKPSRPIGNNEHAAAKMLQDAVGAFVRDPNAGLSNELNWPMYDPKSESTLVKLGSPKIMTLMNRQIRP